MLWCSLHWQVVQEALELLDPLPVDSDPVPPAQVGTGSDPGQLDSGTRSTQAGTGTAAGDISLASVQDLVSRLRPLVTSTSRWNMPQRALRSTKRVGYAAQGQLQTLSGSQREAVLSLLGSMLSFTLSWGLGPLLFGVRPRIRDHVVSAAMSALLAAAPRKRAWWGWRVHRAGAGVVLGLGIKAAEWAGMLPQGVVDGSTLAWVLGLLRLGRGGSGTGTAFAASASVSALSPGIQLAAAATATPSIVNEMVTGLVQTGLVSDGAGWLADQLSEWLSLCVGTLGWQGLRWGVTPISPTDSQLPFPEPTCMPHLALLRALEFLGCTHTFSRCRDSVALRQLGSVPVSVLVLGYLGSI
jgi:hypothetical protein